MPVQASVPAVIDVVPVKEELVFEMRRTPRPDLVNPVPEIAEETVAVPESTVTTPLMFRTEDETV
ncbi:MAG: hypothetical protein ACKO4Z_02885 [Planctomycetota bacterium]